MPRQPLSTKGPDVGFSLGPGFLEQRPAATALIGECIALWTEVELQAAVLLAVMNAMWGEMAEDRRASHRRDDAA